MYPGQYPPPPMRRRPSTSSSKRGTSKSSFNDVIYTTEFQDIGNSYIGKFTSNTIFDPAEASANEGERILELVTVLSTTVPKSERQFGYGDQNTIEKTLKSTILDDPNIAVRVASKRIIIHSRALIQLLQRLLPSQTATIDPRHPLTLFEPYTLISHHYRLLEDYHANFADDHKEATDILDIKKETDEEEKQEGKQKKKQESNREQVDDAEIVGAAHLAKLLHHIRETILPGIAEEEARHARNACTFRMLWLLYKPDMTVYIENHGKLSAFVIQSVTTDKAVLSKVAPDRSKAYKIKAWNLQYDGRYVRQKPKEITIAPFDGEQTIMSLKVRPCQFVDQNDNMEMRRRLEEEGKRWYELLLGGQIFYNGPMLNERRRQVRHVPLNHFPNYKMPGSITNGNIVAPRPSVC